MDNLKQVEPTANGRRDYPTLVVTPNMMGGYSEDDDDEIELRDLFAALKRRWWPLLGVTAISFVGMMAWYVSRPPAYERSFSMAVEPLDRLTGRDFSGSGGLAQALSREAGLPTGLSLGGAGGADYGSLITILQSELILDPVVEAIRVQTQNPDFSHGALLGNLTIEQVEQSKILGVTFESEDPDLVQRVITELQSAYLNYSTETQQMAMIRRLNDLNAQVALQQQEVANTQASLLQFQRQSQILNLESAAESLEERRSEVSSEQQATQTSLQTTLERYNLLRDQVGLQPAEARLVANLSESPAYQRLLTQYQEIENEIALESARFRENTPIIQALQDRQDQLLPLMEAEVERNLGDIVTAAGPITPQTLSAQGGLGRQARDLVETINQLQVLEVEYQSRAQIYDSLSEQIDNLATLGSTSREIERNLQLAEVALQGLLAAQQELKLQLEAQSTPWVIVSGYDLTTPLEPENRLMLGLALSLMASTVLGLGSVFVLEMLDRSYHSAEQASESSQLPILGTVPWVRQLPALVPLPDGSRIPAAVGALSGPAVLKPQPSGQTAFETAFQTLDANLRLLSAHSPVQIVAISSCDTMAGKTTVAAHLAVASARSGRKVLLIDGDLRGSAVGQRFGLRPPVPMPGSSLAKEAVMPEIQSVLEDGTLDVLQGASTHGMAPAGFLASAPFERFLKQCRSHYDLILLDTPTSLNVAETKIVSQYADGLLVVIKLGQTNRELVNGALKDFRTASKTPLLGLVANGVEAR